MNFAQCYYTSIGGWKGIGSSNLSQDTKQLFVTMQTHNAPKNQHRMDAAGKPLNLFEIESDGRNCYAARCRYGFLDQGGRPNMFAHGYLCQWNKAMIVDPAEFCFIDEENYVGSKEQVDLEAQPKVTEIRGFMPAMQAAGFVGKNFAMLTMALQQCINRKETLYLALEQEGKALQAVIYCIYLAMPYSIRTKLSFANAAITGSKEKSVILCKAEHLPKNLPYFNLTTGENNVMPADWMEKYKKTPYLAKFATLGPDAAQVYFAELDKKLVQLGKQDSASGKVLHLADTLMQIDKGIALSMDDISLLYLLMTTPGGDDAMMDRYIAPVLQRIVDQQTELTDEMLTMVTERLSKTENITLLKIKAFFRRQRLMTMEREQAAADVLEMKRHSEDGELQGQEFQDALKFLFESKKGRDIFGAAVRMDYLQAAQKNYEMLADTYGDCTQLECDPTEMREFLVKQAFELFAHEMSSDVETSFTRYITFLSSRLEADALDQAGKLAKSRYWDLFDLTMFSPKATSEYRMMQLNEHISCDKALNFSKLLAKSREAALDDVARLYLAMLQRTDLSVKERTYLYDKCRNHCMANAQGGLSDFSALIRVATYGKQKNNTALLTELLALGVNGMQENWIEILKGAPCFMVEGEFSAAQQEQFVETVRGEAQATVSKSEKELAEYILAGYRQILDEKKMMEKQAKKAQKEEQMQQRKEQATAVFGKIGSFIGKKNEEVTTVAEPVESKNPYEASSQDGVQQDMIYSGRDLGQMTEIPSIAQNPQGEENAQPKKGKLAQFFGKIKK